MTSDEMDLSGTARVALKALEHDICDHCLGRLFARFGFGLSNKERGKAIRTYLAMELESKPDMGSSVSSNVLQKLPTHARSPDERDELQKEENEEENDWNETSTPAFGRPFGTEEEEGCWLCRDVFLKVEDLAKIIHESSKQIEYGTFQIGCKVDPQTINREQTLWQELEPSGPEPIKEELNRMIGKAYAGLEPDKVFERSDPDVAFIIDPLYYTVSMQIKPVFIYGRYRKLIRGIPQTRWPCRSCKGKGCDNCNGTGRMYEISIEELIGEYGKKILDSEDFKLHGMGREDVDVLSLGDGRPFIIEFSRPRKREIDLSEFEGIVNKNSGGKIEIRSLRTSVRKEIPKIKDGTTKKSYRATISVKDGFEEESLKYNISLLAQSPIRQRTPTRVAHRRADKVRSRNVHEISTKILDNGMAEIDLITDGGLYIKELLHGDNGRTEPSLSSLLEKEITVESLDVTGVLYEENGQ